MGLDMYLLRRVPTAEESSYDELGYWRKANHIHNWFVNNIQDGNDDCGYYPVTKDQLLELYNLCKEVKERCKLIDGEVNNGYTYTPEGGKVYHKEKGKVIENPEVAEELLPTAEGFFFGSTDYDEGYMQDVEETMHIIETALAEDQDTLYYHSSW